MFMSFRTGLRSCGGLYRRNRYTVTSHRVSSTALAPIFATPRGAAQRHLRSSLAVVHHVRNTMRRAGDMPRAFRILLFVLAASLAGCEAPSHAQGTGSTPRDAHVREFLDRHRGKWRDLNVPESDGRL